MEFINSLFRGSICYDSYIIIGLFIISMIVVVGSWLWELLRIIEYRVGIREVIVNIVICVRCMMWWGMFIIGVIVRGNIVDVIIYSNITVFLYYLVVEKWLLK